MLRIQEPTVRLNSHVRLDQKAYIKRLAAKTKKGEGQINREIIDYYMINHKKIK